MGRAPRRVTGEGTFTPWVLGHVVSWFRAFTTAALAVRIRRLPRCRCCPCCRCRRNCRRPPASIGGVWPDRPPRACEAAACSWSRGFPSVLGSGGPRGAGRLGVTVQRSGGKTSVDARFYAELTVRGEGSSPWVTHGPLTGRRSRVRAMVVDDAQPLAEAIAAGLRDQAIAADVAFDGVTAEEQLAVNDYDVVILDRDLPLLHGDDICRSLSSSGAMVRILMLTAAGNRSTGSKGSVSAPMTTWPSRSRSLSSSPGSALGPARPPDPPVLERAGIRLDPARGGHEKWPAVAAEAQGTRGPRRAAPVRWRHRVRRATAGKGLGREHRPVHPRRPGHDMTLRRKLGQPPLIETVPAPGTHPMKRVTAPALSGLDIRAGSPCCTAACSCWPARPDRDLVRPVRAQLPGRQGSGQHSQRLGESRAAHGDPSAVGSPAHAA